MFGRGKMTLLCSLMLLVVAVERCSGANERPSEAAQRYYCLSESDTVMRCAECCSAYQLTGTLKSDVDKGAVRCYCEPSDR